MRKWIKYGWVLWVGGCQMPSNYTNVVEEYSEKKVWDSKKGMTKNYEMKIKWDSDLPRGLPPNPSKEEMDQMSVKGSREKGALPLEPED